MKIKLLTVCIGIVLFITSCTPKTGCVKKETKNEMQVRQVVALTNQGLACSPLSLQYRKLSLEEISHYLEMEEDKVAAHLDAMGIHGYFSLIPKNFPPGIEFTLYHIDYKGEIKTSKVFYVCPDGSLVTPLDETSVNLQDNFLVFAKYLPGEPIDFVLGSECGQFYAAVRIVPNAIEVVTEQNQKLSVQMASSDGRRYQVIGEGLTPCGNYLVMSNFENEKSAEAVQANAEGRVSVTMGSTVPWIKGGEASIVMQGEGICRPIYLDFRWFVIPEDLCK